MAGAPAPGSRRSRAERRRAGGPAVRDDARPILSPAMLRNAVSAVWLTAAIVLLILTALAIERKITWYLAVDQYGYLAFAHDLMHGHVLHHWDPLSALVAKLPPRVDVLSQTYVYDEPLHHGVLYCRYAPGFPLLLAGWLLLFGDDGAHYLNPTVFIVLLVLILAFQTRLFRSRWRAIAGVALIVLFPTYLHFWALTLVRDLPTHLAAFLGLYLLLPSGGRRLDARRAGWAGLALGYAGSIRPDAVLYLVPALLVAAWRWGHEHARAGTVLRGLAAGLLGLIVGLTPFFAYNWIATGSPFRPTQGMEIQNFLPPAAPEPAAPAGVGFPPGAWHGATAMQVQGGGLRLANLRSVLPGNIAIFRAWYGDLLLAVALWGAVLALVQRRPLFLTAVPYSILALLFYSCWSRPDADSRYLLGVHLFLPMLIVEGTLGTVDLARRVRRLGNATAARGFAATIGLLLVAGALLNPEPQARDPLPTLLLVVPAVGAAAALAASLWPERRVAGLAAPVLALVVVGLACSRAAQGRETRATFQRPQMLRARATFARAVEPGAVVITTEDVGRPAENIDYYSAVARAMYLTDLERWGLSVPDVADLLARKGLKPYLLIPTIQPGRAQMLQELRERFHVVLAADIPAPHAIDYFVAAAFYPRGIHMELYRLEPKSAGQAP